MKRLSALRLKNLNEIRRYRAKIQQWITTEFKPLNNLERKLDSATMRVSEISVSLISATTRKSREHLRALLVAETTAQGEIDNELSIMLDRHNKAHRELTLCTKMLSLGWRWCRH